MTCPDAQPLLARYVDDVEGLPPSLRADLVAHVEACASCCAELRAQREVAAILRRRPQAVPRPGLASRIGERIDRETSGGLLDLANWRAWTSGLAPLAAALMIAVYLDPSRGDVAPGPQPPAQIDDWTGPAFGSPAAARFLQAPPNGDALIEVVLTAAPAAGYGHGR